MQRTILYCLFFLLAIPLTFAQRKAKQDTTYNQKVVLEREFSPIFKDASRIETLPAVSEPKREKQPIQYQFSRLDASTPLQWKAVAPEKKMDRYYYSPQTGFINIGLGLPANSLIYGGLVLLNDETNQLNFTIDHRAISDNRKSRLNTEKQNVYNADTKLGLNYSRPFEAFTLNSTVNYIHSEFNYLNFNFTPIMPFIPLVAFDNSTLHQSNNQLLFSVESSPIVNGDLSYKGSINYSYFQKAKGTTQSFAGPKEHIVTLNGWITKNLEGQKSIGLDLALINFVYNLNPNDPFTLMTAQNYGRLSLTPHYNFKDKNWVVNAGIRTEISFKKGLDLKVAPAIDATWEFSPKFFAIANIGGGSTIHSFAQSDNDYRYLTPNCRLEDTFSPLDATFRIKTNLNPRLDVELLTGFKSSDEYYFTNSWYNSSFLPVTKTNTKRIQVGIAANYEVKDYGDIHLSINKYKYRLAEIYGNETDKNIAWDKPDLSMNLDANIRINEKITTQLNYQLSTGRYALFNNETTKMNAINQLDLGGRYKINKKWSAFAQLNNLLLQNYDLWYGIPAQNFNFVVGAGFSY